MVKLRVVGAFVSFSTAALFLPRWLFNCGLVSHDQLSYWNAVEGKAIAMLIVRCNRALTSMAAARSGRAFAKRAKACCT
jgi:hypothetical protein